MRCAVNRSNGAGRRLWRVAGAILALLLAGCATRPPQVLTPKLVPSRFMGSSMGTAPVWPRAGWWRRFGTPELTRLIVTAQANNRSLEAAAARLRESRAEVTIQRAALFPAIDARAQAQRTGVGRDAYSANGRQDYTSNSFGLSADAAYGLDVWGLARDNLHSAEQGVKSARFARQALGLSVTASVADTYFTLLALRQRIGIAKEDIAAIDGILKVVKLKVKAGTASHLDLAQEQAQFESVEAQLPVLAEQALEERISLAVLLGMPPETLRLTGRPAGPIRLPEVRPGLPSSLLLRRPDVAEAEANLAAAHANLQAARAAFLPQISLGGSAGFSGVAANALLHGPGFLWDAGAQLVQSVFDGGRLVGEKDLAYARQQALVADYENAVLAAYADVETALGQVRNTKQAQAHLREEVVAAREAFRISELQYRQGAAGLLTVLQAQQTLFGARDRFVGARLARRQALVHLYQALGGGWREPRRDRTQFMSGGRQP